VRSGLAAATSPRSLVMFSDPVERRRADGTLVMPGHVGVIDPGIPRRLHQLSGIASNVSRDNEDCSTYGAPSYAVTWEVDACRAIPRSASISSMTRRDVPNLARDLGQGQLLVAIGADDRGGVELAPAQVTASGAAGAGSACGSKAGEVPAARACRASCPTCPGSGRRTPGKHRSPRPARRAPTGSSARL